MGFISVAVILYQIFIFSIVATENASKGSSGILTWLAVGWTLTHVVFPPLMALQLVTIAVAAGYGKSKHRRFEPGDEIEDAPIPRAKGRVPRRTKIRCRD